MTDTNASKDASQEPRELKTPKEWLRVEFPGVVVLDPDGWRGANDPSWETPISLDDMRWRLNASTCKWPEALIRRELARDMADTKPLSPEGATGREIS